MAPTAIPGLDETPTLARGQLTPQQRVAVQQREVSVVLSSGAGCGKTHVLTERYLSHLREDGADVSQIVAITFTDRAARQMRRRIRQAVLHELETAGEEVDAERWARICAAWRRPRSARSTPFAARCCASLPWRRDSIRIFACWRRPSPATSWVRP